MFLILWFGVMYSVWSILVLQHLLRMQQLQFLEKLELVQQQGLWQYAPNFFCYESVYFLWHLKVQVYWLQQCLRLFWWLMPFVNVHGICINVVYIPYSGNTICKLYLKWDLHPPGILVVVALAPLWEVGSVHCSVPCAHCPLVRCFEFFHDSC